MDAVNCCQCVYHFIQVHLTKSQKVFHLVLKAFSGLLMTVTLLRHVKTTLEYYSNRRFNPNVNSLKQPVEQLAS